MIRIQTSSRNHPGFLPGIALFVIATFCSAPVAFAQGSKNVSLLAHLNNYAGYSACWTYVHTDGREYAILGTTTGTSIVNVTNPAAAFEVGFIPGLSSAWREMKQYLTYVYISTEATGGGIQIVSMANPDAPVLVNTYLTGFNHAHTLEVDPGRALLFCNGTRQDAVQTGMRVLSLADPVNPVEVGRYTIDYVHDCFPRGDRLYVSCISSATMRVLDLTDPSLLFEINSWTYPKAFTHSAETSKDGNYLYICDELNYGTMKVFDIHDIMAPSQILEITRNPLAIIHNIHVRADTGYVAYYTEGIRLFDLSDPTLPTEWGYYDTYTSYSGGFHGVWEIAKFPSGTFIASDINSGLWVFRSNPNYGMLKLKIVNPSNASISGADVTSVGETDSTQTQASGMIRLALSPGPHNIRVKKFGYKTTVFPVSTVKGAHDSVQVVLQPEPLAVITGSVRRASDSAGLEGADMDLEGSPLETESVTFGDYAFNGVPQGNYTMHVVRAGYVPLERLTPVVSGVSRTANFSMLRAAWYDSCDTDKGWSLSSAGDNATTGLWVRADPVGTSGSAAPVQRPPFSRGDLPRLAGQHEEPAEGLVASGPIQPEDDHSPGAGGLCFITGNGVPGGAPGNSDVDFGKTTLTTPPLNMTGLTDPYFHFASWYYYNSPGEPDSFVVEVSGDGNTWVKVRSYLESRPWWSHDSFRVRDYITPTAIVRVRFTAQDQPPEGIVEAAVDDFEFYDGALMPSAVEPSETPAPVVSVSAPRPNPASRSTSFTLFLPMAGPARVAVYDASGREVRRLLDGTAPSGPMFLAWDGKDSRGRTAASGVYWIRALAGASRIERKLVWVR